MEEILQLQPALFHGIAREDMLPMLSCTGYHIANYRRHEALVLEEDRVRHVGIVLTGAVDMVKEDIWGNKTLLLRVRRQVRLRCPR